MTQLKAKQIAWLLAVVTIAVPVLSNTANAQQRTRSVAERRQRPGAGFWENQRAARNLRFAREYSRGLYGYSRDASNIDPEVAKAESEALGRSIEAAKKELAATRKRAAGDKETLAALDAIDKHVAKASESHTQLHEECCKDAPDGDVTMHCCSDVTKELEKAIAEHAALLRKLELRAATQEKKAEPKKE